MDNFPSQLFLSKMEAACLFSDPEEEFVHGLRQSLVEHAEKLSVKSVDNKNPARKASFPMLFPQKTWAIIGWVLALLITALIFRQPVLAAAGRLFGYGYFPPAGFVQLDTARILSSPVKQEHAGRSLTVLSGLATPEYTTLWLEYSDTAQAADGAWLETPAGERIDLSNWNWEPNQPDTKGIRLQFPPLPDGVSQMTLAFPEGWRLPLTWIPASQSNLPDVHVVPYVEPDAEQTQVSTAPTDYCVEQHALRFCVLAATTTVENTSLLVDVQSDNPEISPSSLFQGLVWSTETDPVTLRDEQGNIFSMTDQQGDILVFPPLAVGEQKVTLVIPAVLATVNIPDQIIRIDMGENPQPDQVVSLNADIQVLNTTVRFRKATFIGDGVNSLRLTLDAEPVETIDGITPFMLDMGKPARVDDLYGSGNLAGSKDLFVELVRPQGKINGVLELPVVQATVMISGPFEFTFSLSQMTPQASPTPAAANPDDFSPAPTPTPMALDTYRFTGRLPQPGDLLFTVMEGETTGLYAADPTSQFEPEQIAILPGQVYQVYLHPDRLGVDYLAGVRVTEDGFTFYRSAQVYTLRFNDARPILLAEFPRGPEMVKGTELTADWSYDGRLMVFQLFNFAAKQGEPSFKTGWIDLSCRATGNCTTHYLDFPDGLSIVQPQFSPNDYRILMSGSYINGKGSGAQDIFMLEFDQEGIPGEVVNLSDSDQIDELVPRWDPKSGKMVVLCPADPVEAQSQFCFYDPVTKNRQEGAAIDQHLYDYQVEPNGDRLLGIDINHQATDGKGLLEFRLFDWDGKSGLVLASTPQGIDRFEESPDGKYFAYIAAETFEMHLVNISNGEEISAPASNISWMGWAK
ncbi:MAG: hypothetical protein LLG42_02600 [Chloroflexi bacterium]|nr:hypothetical protein [Chloroflexota bacterium]